jgi:hypothetical protein
MSRKRARILSAASVVALIVAAGIGGAGAAPANADQKPAAASSQGTFVVDSFTDQPAGRWAASASTGASPQLTFDAAMTMSWSRGSAQRTMTAKRAVTDQDWSGYDHLQATIRTRDIKDQPAITLTATDGSSFTARTPRNVKIVPAGHGLVTLDVDLRRTTRELLARVNGISVAASAGRLGGSLSVTSISLGSPRGFYGPTTFIDPALSTYNYKGRDWNTIAGRIHAQGFTAIHLIVLDFDQDYSEIVDAMHNVGMKVSLTIFPTTNVQAYTAHPDWRQKSLGGDAEYSWRVYLSPTNSDFVTWLHSQVTRLMDKYDFDGLSVDEPWYEVWGGPSKDNPEHAHYMDVSDSARAAFAASYGFDPLTELFLKDADGTYYLNPAQAGSKEYQEWVQFRIDTVNSFMAGLADTARAAKPGIAIFLTCLADVRIPGGAGKAPEYQAQDLDSMQTAVRPQGIIFESAWQDWLQPNLDPSYVLDYANAYVPQLHKGVAGLGQPDVGSVIQRDFPWVKEFSADAWHGGFSGYVTYEWSIGNWPTGGPPLPYGSSQ